MNSISKSLLLIALSSCLGAFAHNENFKNPPILPKEIQKLSGSSAAVVIAEYINYEIPSKLQKDESFKKQLSLTPVSGIRLNYRIVKQLKGPNLNSIISVPDDVYLECKNNVISVKDLSWLPKKNSKWIFFLKSINKKEADELGFNCWFSGYGGRVPCTQAHLKVVYDDLVKK